MPLDEDGQWVNLHDLRRTSITWLQQMRFTVEERSIFKGAKPSGVTEAVYSQADQEDIRLRCARDIEARIKDVEAGDEATMFDPWKTRLRRLEDRPNDLDRTDNTEAEWT
jgi:hypothetical protein